MHLLVLDDDAKISAFLGDIARNSGWTVETSLRETEFQAHFAESRPHAIMLDLQLGASDGVEQLRFLCDANYDGVVVLMSGFDQRVLTSAEQLGQSLGLVIAATLEKPIRAARVRAVLADIAHRIEQPEGPASPAKPTAREASGTSGSITPATVERALSGHETELYLQPIVSAPNLVVKRFEALIRWNRPSYGLVMPDQFIPVAEQDQALIDRLTYWVIEAALEHHRRLAELGFDMQLCVNVSGLNLHSLDFPDRVAGLVDRFGAKPAALGFEVTESVAMRNPREITDILTRMRLKGFALGLDDFGTGFSSLTALRQMPFTALKIDKSFVADMLTSRDALVIVKSVIDLALNMGMVSVAEGVETAETVKKLMELGINAFQGYYFSRPLPFDQAVAWLEAWPHRPPSPDA